MNLEEFEEWLKQAEITADPSEVSNFNAWAQNQPAATSRHQFAEHTRGLFSTVDNSFDLRVEISYVEKEVEIAPESPKSDFMTHLKLDIIHHYFKRRENQATRDVRYQNRC